MWSIIIVATLAYRYSHQRITFHAFSCALLLVSVIAIFAKYSSLASTKKTKSFVTPSYARLGDKTRQRHRTAQVAPPGALMLHTYTAPMIPTHLLTQCCSCCYRPAHHGKVLHNTAGHVFRVYKHYLGAGYDPGTPPR